MTERRVKLTHKHVAKTAREIWKLMEQDNSGKANVGGPMFGYCSDN